ncbi:helix-turn-helix transcriptional regulator [Nocardia higoensis]|uniref:Helix-turn-helix transcriptional regulator n=1 Tax=Nocardia higoensis TaxID=228599 RepID=A0ABS0D9A7_9NOCA|nr:helix-turn-helix domain-containing protein [Nocardia higoensis]MBF6354227.1 helix-turn-helix transcriptional regulator [Nocardia higoensis]
MPRSNCPINRGVELLGDHWSLVILRDVTFCDHRTFRDLLTGSREGISPPTLSRRLAHLVETGLLHKAPAPRGSQGRYSLTEKGIELVPLLFELARVGHLLDPSTASTEPRFEGWYGDGKRIHGFMDELRSGHL